MACSVAVTDFMRAGDARTAERLAIGRKRIGVVEIDDVRAVAQRAGQVDAELLDDVALDFGDGDLEHDLVAAADDDGVDDLVAVLTPSAEPHAEEPRRDVVGLLRFGLARDACRTE